VLRVHQPGVRVQPGESQEGWDWEQQQGGEIVLRLHGRRVCVQDSVTKKNPMKYKIKWTNLSTGQTGIGKTEFEEARAVELVDELNAEYPTIDHVLVPVPEETAPAPAAVPVQPVSAPPAPIPPQDFTQLTDKDLFPFGQFKGVELWEVPSRYLDWFRGQPQLMRAWPAIADYINRNASSIDEDLKRKEREK